MITRKPKALAALAAAALIPAIGLTSCGDTETEWVTAPTISAAQAAVTAPDGGGTVSATCEAAWIDGLDCSEEGRVGFSVAENPSTQIRQTETKPA